MLNKKIENHARSLCFDLIGFTEAKLDEKHSNKYEKWLDKNYHADLKYMEKTKPRLNLSEILPGTKTVIILATNYYHKQKELKEGFGRIARYAYGRDYHKIIKKDLKILENYIKQLDKNTKTKSYVDTGPILERAYAQQAGLGFIGKNSCLITKEFGSWVFLSVILTTLKLHTNKSTLASFSCGTCQKCIDDCPSKAICKPGVIDCSNCLSYHTIENKKHIPLSLHSVLKKSNCLFGCDICQQVCPHNCRAKTTRHKNLLSPKIAGDQQSLQKILSIKTNEEYLKEFAGSPLIRPKLKKLQQTAKILSG